MSGSDASRQIELVSLVSWLGSLATMDRPCVLLGGAGHLLLSEQEEAQSRQKLESEILPRLASVGTDAQIQILTGLAPGGDLVFSETASAWLKRLGRDYRRVGLFPVPKDVLWADWLARAGSADPALVAETHYRFEAAIEACDEWVALWDTRRPPDWTELPQRQQQYRRLAAVLAEQCDVLITIQRPGHPQQPGGTSELVVWRQQPGAIPAAMKSGARRHLSAWRQGDQLAVVDPGAPSESVSPVKSWLERAREALRSGNYLHCYDLVARAESQGHATDDLQYLKLLALANSGSTETALRRLQDLPMELRNSSEDWIALEGRLYKDLALRGGIEANQHYRQAASCYQAAYIRTQGYFSGINAATMTLLGGDQAHAQLLARKVLALVQNLKEPDEASQYYLRVTEAEAALILRDLPRAGLALTEANRLLRENINARSRTRQQLSLLCWKLELDEYLLENLEIPPVLYLPPVVDGSQSLPRKIGQQTASLVFAGITDPAELGRAIQFARKGARVHAVLAAPPERMMSHWDAEYGTAAREQLQEFLQIVQETSIARGFLDQEDRWCDAYVGSMALGLSRLAAKRLGCAWRTLDSSGELSDGADLEQRLRQLALRAASHAYHRTEGDMPFERRFAGIIFADFAGFSRLPDEELPRFTTQFMGNIAQCLDKSRTDILLQHSWGDALHVVTTTASVCAVIACEIQESLERLRLSLPGALTRLEMRLSAHYAPLYSGLDPIEERKAFFGGQLSLTARIEPVTPPGMIFVTEAFAAQLALEAPTQFRAEYAGEIELAKSFGKYRLFSLRRQRT